MEPIVVLEVMRKLTGVGTYKAVSLANLRCCLYTPPLFVKSSGEGGHFMTYFWRIQILSVSGRVFEKKRFS